MSGPGSTPSVRRTALPSEPVLPQSSANPRSMHPVAQPRRRGGRPRSIREQTLATRTTNGLRASIGAAARATRAPSRSSRSARRDKERARPIESAEFRMDRGGFGLSPLMHHVLRRREDGMGSNRARCRVDATSNRAAGSCMPVPSSAGPERARDQARRVQSSVLPSGLRTVPCYGRAAGASARDGERTFGQTTHER